MTVRPEHRVASLVAKILMVVAMAMLLLAILAAIAFAAAGWRFGDLWFAELCGGALILATLCIGTVAMMNVLARYGEVLRSRDRVTAGRAVELVALGQMHSDLAPTSELGWLVLDAESLTFTPDPELPSYVEFHRRAPEPGREAQLPAIPRGAIVKIASEVVRDGYTPVLRIRWTEPATGREAFADFGIMGRHRRWVAASPDRPARPARLWRGRRGLPRAIARFHEPAAGEASAPATGDQRRDALAKSK